MQAPIYKYCFQYAFYLVDGIQPYFIHLCLDECTDFIKKFTCAIKLLLIVK